MEHMDTSSQPRILLVDDDAMMTEHLSAVMARGGMDVQVAGDGQEALARIAQRRPDLVVLDILMPTLDGRATLRAIRADGDWLPVILLTEIGESFERAAALDEGADDYLTKPFDPVELLARIRAVLRRASVGAPPLHEINELTSGPLRVDRGAHRVFLDGRECQLTPRAFTVLEFLMNHADDVVTRERLLERVWGFESLVATRAVDLRVAEIRRVLGESGNERRFIDTVQGVGYRFMQPVERS